MNILNNWLFVLALIYNYRIFILLLYILFIWITYHIWLWVAQGNKKGNCLLRHYIVEHCGGEFVVGISLLDCKIQCCQRNCRWCWFNISFCSKTDRSSKAATSQWVGGIKRKTAQNRSQTDFKHLNQIREERCVLDVKRTTSSQPIC